VKEATCVPGSPAIRDRLPLGDCGSAKAHFLLVLRDVGRARTTSRYTRPVAAQRPVQIRREGSRGYTEPALNAAASSVDGIKHMILDQIIELKMQRSNSINNVGVRIVPGLQCLA